MGVPKFYRWISERYPCLSEVVKEYQVPEFDNLYLDMNGIIHVCSHPNDDDPHFRITEEQIFKDIFHYIEVLFRIIRPRKVFFMAVDGVAPRAKMNQQRGRRFRSAKEAEENIKKALQKGEMLPEEKRFDSNCITPGTKFMVRLQEQLEYMVKSKVSSDPAWQDIRIFLSGHETPGEGEHKITEFIRQERMKASYDPNTRHCLYGLDADLMMLGLCSHEPHFSLLREEVRFTGKKKHHAARTPKPEETTFHLLHLSLMREYIDHEFQLLKKTLPFQYDLEAIIDDWVLMGFLVGNDFIPHLPNLHIAHNALPMLYDTYKQVLPTLDGYLNENGIVNLARFEKYLEVLSLFDFNKFEEVYADFKWLESKVGKKKGKGAKGVKNASRTKNAFETLTNFDDGESSEGQSSDMSMQQKSIQVVTELSIKQGLTSADSEAESNGSQDDGSTYQLEFQLFKRNYYQEKLHFKGTDAEVQKIAYEYILAIQWICHYYYNGVQSWSWYYPYHYAPFLSDLRNLSQMKLKYDIGNPFLPYEQLLAVLPAASKECLPESFWNLMSSSTSSIIDYYPLEFQCDLNGKQQEWEAVVLIPFINEERLLAAMQPCLNSLSKSEKERNKHSGCQLYTFDSNLDYYVKSSLEGTFPNVAHCKAKLDIVALHSWSSTDISSFVKGVLPGCRLSVYYPGFPTLYHLPHSSSLQKKGVKVFQMPSRNENMILSIYSPGETPPDLDIGSQPYKSTDNLDDVAKNLLGTSIYVNWPHMEEAKVVAVSDENVKYEVTEHIHATGLKGSKHKMQRKTLPKDEQKIFWQDLDSISESYMTSRGIDVGETQFLVYAQPLLGRKYVCGQQGQITLEKQWATVPRAYALQATVKDISVKDPTFQQFKGMEELFPTGSTVFMLGQPHYGCQGKVTQVHNEMTSVVFDTRCEPDIESVIRQRHKLNMAYYPGWELGSRLGISNYLVSRITGTIFVFYPNTQKWQVGLNLRFTKEGCGIAGYTKFVNSEWRYSEAVEKTLVEYMEKFPEVLTYLGSALKRNENDFDAQKMVKLSEESDVVARLKELSAWLKSLNCYHGDKVNEHSDMIENKVVMAVVEKVEQCKKKKPLNPVEITLRPHVLYRPLAHQGTLIPDKSAQHRLLDRIVNARDGYTVPLGLRGTIIGIHKQPAQDVLFDVVFDEEFLGGIEFGGRCPKRRGYRMPECAMINLSYGMRFGNKEKRPTAVVRPQNKQHMKQQAQPQSGRDRQVPARRDSSPRYSRSNRDTRQTPRESQRVQSNFQPTLMQRPTSSSAQSTRPKAANPSSSDNMFDTLWNTLKEQNKESSPISQQQESQKAANVNQRSTRRKESRGVPVITAPDPQNLGKALSGSPLGIPNFTSLSLSQAAKSLPKVKPMQNEKNTEKKQSSTMITSSSTVSSATVESRKERSHSQQTSTKPTTTVTQSVSGPDSTSAEHLDNLFKKIKGAPAQSPSYAPRLAFTPTQHIPSPRITSPMKSPPMRMPGPPSPMNHPMNIPPFHPQFGPRQQYPNQYPPFFSRPPFVLPPGPRNMPPNFPGMFLNRPITRNPTTFSQQPFPRWLNNDTTSTKHDQTFIPTQVYLQSKKQKNEGTQKLSELLNSENDDASSSKWSTGEEEDDKSKASDNTQTATSDETAKENITKKFDDISIKDEDDGDSLKDDEDYMERSTSVEDENPAILKKQTKVDELMSLCTQCSMMPPIYTYFTTGDEQVVSTVQLWNGVRFSSHPQITRDKAMEEAAGQALGYLKSELRENRPVSTSPPTTLPYYMPVQNLVPPQYYAHHAAYASPVSYTSASPQPYFIPSVPYTVLPQTPVVTIPSEYQQATLVHSHFRLNAHQYNPYVHQYPLVRVQVSPSHQPKPAYHIAANPKPVVWTGYPKDPYFIQDKANSPRTEFKLLDQPPASTNPEDESTELRPNALLTEESSKQSTEGYINIQNGDDKKETEPKKHVKKTSSPSRKKQNSAKPKLAISFNNSAKEK